MTYVLFSWGYTDNRVDIFNMLKILMFQLSELLLQEPQHQQPELLILLLQHRGRGHGAEALQVSHKLGVEDLCIG